MKYLVTVVVIAGVAILALFLLTMRVPAGGAVLLEEEGGEPARVVGPGWHLRPFGRKAVVYASLATVVAGEARVNEGATPLRYRADVALDLPRLADLHQSMGGDFEQYVRTAISELLADLASRAPPGALFSDAFRERTADVVRQELEREGFVRAQVTIEPLDVEALLATVRTLAPAGAAGDLRLPVTRALETDPKSWRLHAALGMINESEKLIAEAETNYLDALALDPGALPPMERLLTIYSTVGEWQKLQRVLDAALAAHPDSVPHLNWTGLVLLKRRDLVGAERALSHAMERSPDNPTIMANMGTLLMNTGRNDAAIAMFRRATELAPGDARALVNLGSALAASDRFEEALEPLERAEASGVLSHNLASTLAIVHEHLGHTEKASAYRAQAEALKQQEREVPAIPAASPPA